MPIRSHRGGPGERFFCAGQLAGAVLGEVRGVSGVLHDPFGRIHAPRSLTRDGRVDLIGEACEDLLADRMPEREGAVLLAAAFLGWLESDGTGDLVRDYLRIAAERGSHVRPQAIWARHSSSPMSDRRGGPRQDDPHHVNQDRNDASNSQCRAGGARPRGRTR